jgi:hypothetical protein
MKKPILLQGRNKWRQQYQPCDPRDSIEGSAGWMMAWQV